jgi:fatty aldehyde decarbonylase
MASVFSSLSPSEPRTERSEHYRKLLSFVITNAWMGENMAVENYSEMVPLFSTVDEKIEAVHQAKDEGKHVLVLEKLAKKAGCAIDDNLIEEEWKTIRATFREAARKGDLAACLIIQDLMVEALAVGMYRTFAGDSNQDRESAKVAGQLLDDELRHLDIGVRRINALMEKDSDAVHDSLVWAHSRVMPCLFAMVHNACDFLCAKNIYCKSELAYVEGGELYLDGKPKSDTFINLESLKIAALEHYVGMLDTTGFESRVTNQLISSMAAYEVPGRVDLGIRETLQGRRPAAAEDKCC